MPWHRALAFVYVPCLHDRVQKFCCRVRVRVNANPYTGYDAGRGALEGAHGIAVGYLSILLLLRYYSQPTVE